MIVVCAAGVARELSSQDSQALRHVVTRDVPGLSAEIVAVWPEGGRVLYTDSVEKRVRVLRFLPEAAGGPDAVLDLDQASGEGWSFAGEPTSVAMHPREPIAFVTVLGRGDARGEVVALDLRPGHGGERLWSATVGFHPDSLAVDRSGRWIVVADEAEGVPGARGTISLLDLAAMGGGMKTPPRHSMLDPEDVLGPQGRRIEPEFVAMDPAGRFAVVTCQENDAAVLVDVRGDPAFLPASLRLPEGAEPDGAAVADGYRDPELGPGCLVALAEEGRKVRGRWRGQAASLWWVGPEPSFERAAYLGSLDVAAAVGREGKNCSPEGVALLRRAGRTLLLVTVERADRLLLADVTDPRHPVLLDQAHTGSRPEGVCLLARGPELWVFTGDEGDGGPGEVSVFRLP